MKRLLRKIYVKLQYIRIALLKINKPHLGDIVTYNNIKCALIQGVANPKWDLLPLTKENLEKNKRDVFRFIHKDKFKLQPIWKRAKFSFMITYNFYMSNWFDIDMNKKGKIAFAPKIK